MEPARSSCVGSGNSGTYTSEIAESLRFEEEIQSLINPSFDASPAAGASFTALLGLPANQAVELLHEFPASAAASSSSPAAAGELWRLRLGEHVAAAPLRLPLGCSPTFPSNAALVERAARFSVFATEDSPASSSGGGPSPGLKTEPPDSDSPPTLPLPDEKPQRPAKRKEGANSKAKAPAKKSKSAEENSTAAKAAAEDSTDGDKLPYVHVRVRRGQATDSHSLAERARREKINARMKLLQELVPGCSKITGTALVLDEIINHVQSLQRQVEFLSMRLAAVNPRIDFSGLDGFLSAECGPLTAGNGRSGMALDPAMWSSSEVAAGGMRRLPQQQIWHADLVRPQQSSTMWERDAVGAAHPHVFLNPGTSLFGYDPANSVPLNSNQLKTEL